MKRILFLVATLLCFAFSNAQVNAGIKAGFNSSLSVNNFGSVFDGTYNLNSVQDEMWNNFHVGAFARIYMNRFYIEPAVLYSIEKKKYEISFEDISIPDIKSIINIKTIDVPLLLGLKLVDIKIANLRVFTGPKLRMDAGTTPKIKDVSEFISDIKKLNLGYVMGVGVDLLMFSFDLQYTLIGNMYEPKIENIKFDPASTFVLSIAWKLF